jgi:hypothetical protein
MIKEGGTSGKKEGILIKYVLNGDDLVFYIPEMRHPFIANYKGTSLDVKGRGIRIKSLDEQAIADIAEMVKTITAFNEISRYRKIK